MVKMYLIGFAIWSCLCQQLTLAEPEVTPHRPTNLEDIERDNLKSERHQAFKKEAYSSQPARAASSLGTNHYSVQIEHHPGGATSHAGFNYLLSPSSLAPASGPTRPGVNYVTPIPSGPSITYAKEYVPQYQQKVPQVHEDHSTNTVPSRQSLLQPIIGGSAPAQTLLTPQPQYVYVQAQSQQIQQQPQPQQQQQQQQYSNYPNLPQSLLHILPHHQGAYIMIPSPSYYPQQQQQPHSAQQYAAYVNDPDNHVQTYSHGESGNYSPQPPSSGPLAPAPAPSQKTPPGVIYATPSSTPAPHRHQSPSSEFSIVKSVEPPVYYSPDNYLNSQPTIHYSHSPAKPAIQIHHETQTHYPSLTHPNNGILNYFGVQHKQPTSLLDSYVPSSLQLAPVKHYSYPTKSTPVYRPPYQHFHHHQPHQQLFYQPTYPVSHSAYPIYPTHHTPVANHQIPSASAPAYNTIAYSVPLSQTKTLTQYKRSPALETVAGVKYSHPRAVSSASSPSSHPFSGAITTKLQPAAKLI